MSTIKLIKFISGEEIICEIPDHVTTATHDSSWEVKNAVTLVYHQSEDGKTSVGFAPCMPYTQGNITILLKSVSAMGNVKEQLLKEYNRVFSSIILP